MSISSKIKTVFRGDVPLGDLPREFLRRKKAADRQKRERHELDKINDSPARLFAQFSSLSPDRLLTHFRERNVSFFPFPNDLEQIKRLHLQLFPDETAQMIESANRIVQESKWELAGLGAFEFKAENFWRRDPITGKDWGLEYHADVVVYKQDGADIRILWELNRFGHAVILACAFAVTGDEAYAETFFSHVETWMQQNPYARGANWNCAMEVALRSINLLAAFDIFRRSKACTEERLARILQLFDQHGRFILNNNEFSYIATSNHYLSDVVGLFWIGTLVPELEKAAEWKEFGQSELPREMDKQILPDGADFEASTGYHKFVTELFLYSFLLAKKNGDTIPQKCWHILRRMFEYIHSIMRTDGRVPLIGDADGSQIVPIIKRDADDQAFLLALAAVVFSEPKFKQRSTPEILWLLGEDGINTFRSLQAAEASQSSAAFPDAGTYVMRDADLYLHFNTSDCGVNGRGSHGHNDALSIEISAFGRPFIVDPGSYVYNLDRNARHKFRSTAYHSTVMIDGVEQNTTNIRSPFVLGNEADPRILEYRATPERDVVVGEHYGYRRLPQPITHRRVVTFDKLSRYWHIADKFIGDGTHEFASAFHFANGIEVETVDEHSVRAWYNQAGNGLMIVPEALDVKPVLREAHVSSNYGERRSSIMAVWQWTANCKAAVEWLIVPVAEDEDVAERIAYCRSVANR